MSTAVMNTEKISLAQTILAIDNPEVLDKVKTQIYVVLGYDSKPYTNYSVPQCTVQELQDRLVEAADDARNGRTMTSEEVFSNLENKYPWLCE